MFNIVLGILTFVLILVSLFLILVVLSQKAKTDGGVGAAMGGGMAEAAFGAETNTVLSKMTIFSAILFFVLALTLYLGRLRQHAVGDGGGALPDIAAPAAMVPLTPAPMSPDTGAAAPAAAPGAAATAPATPAPAADAPVTPVPATP